MKKIEEQIQQYFEEQNIPIENEIFIKNRYKALVEKNKTHSNNRFMKRMTLVLSCTICILLCLITILAIEINKKDNPTIYYTDGEAIKQTINKEEFSEFIEKSFPQYTFLITDCEYESAIGFYTPEIDTLLAVYVEASSNEVPFTLLKIYIVINDQFHLDAHDSYIINAKYQKTENCEIYTKTETNVYYDCLLGYISYPNYNLYIRMDAIDMALFERFF